MAKVPPICITRVDEYTKNPPTYYRHLGEHPLRKQLNQLGYRVSQTATVCTVDSPVFNHSGSVFRTNTMADLDNLASVVMNRPIILNATVKYSDRPQEQVIVTVNPDDPTIRDQLNNAFIEAREMMNVQKEYTISVSFVESILQYYSSIGASVRSVDMKHLTIANCKEEIRPNICTYFVIGFGLITAIIMLIIALFYLFFFIGWLCYKLHRKLSIETKKYEINAPVAYVADLAAITQPGTVGGATVRYTAPSVSQQNPNVAPIVSAGHVAVTIQNPPGR